VPERPGAGDPPERPGAGDPPERPGAGHRVRAYAPGRVNLIGDHTDYAGGLALPMAIDLGTTVEGTRHGEAVVLTSDAEAEPASVPLGVVDPARVTPAWARYVAGVVAEMHPRVGLAGHVSSTLPVGGGLSSSAALEVALALALGFEGGPGRLAALCQRAEQRSSGVPSGIMDQLASAAGEDGMAMLIDFATLEVTRVPVPEDVDVVVVDSGQRRALAGSAYAERRAEVERAANVVGPLRDVTTADLDRIAGPVLRRRARHVLTENARVLAFAAALAADDPGTAGRLMVDSHVSLRDDFEVSTAVLDALVDRLTATRGVHGARVTGAGFGGCVVALTEPGALGDEGWTVRASAGARLLD
jgi:galactokinase